ncbi:MAG: tetratricopeptide repeat protein [Bryobacterales bacterium]
MSATALAVLLMFPQLVDSTDRNRQLTAAEQEADLSPERRGDIYVARKMYREAVDAYRQALDEQPRNARLYNKLGISFHHQLMFGEAKRHYERASKLDEKYAQAVNNLGTIYYAERNYKKAQKSYEKALKITPNSASIYSNLGTAFFARRKYEKASQAYLRALEIDPEVFEHRNEMGTLLQERSVEDLGKYHYFMAEAYARVGAFDRALLYLRRSIEEGYAKPEKVAKEKLFEPMLEMPDFQRLVGVVETAQVQ